MSKNRRYRPKAHMTWMIARHLLLHQFLSKSSKRTTMIFGIKLVNVSDWLIRSHNFKTFRLAAHGICPDLVVQSGSTQYVEGVVSVVFLHQLSCTLNFYLVHAAFLLISIDIGSSNEDSWVRCLHAGWIARGIDLLFLLPVFVEHDHRISLTFLVERCDPLYVRGANIYLFRSTHAKCKVYSLLKYWNLPLVRRTFIFSFSVCLWIFWSLSF